MQRLFTHGPSILHNCRQGWWLALKPCCKLSMSTELEENVAMPDLSCSAWLQYNKKAAEIDYRQKQLLLKPISLLWHTRSLHTNHSSMNSFLKIPLNNAISIICHAILPSSLRYVLCLATGESLDEAWVRCSMNLLHSRPLFAESLLTRWCCHSAKLHSCSTICGSVNYPNVSGSSSVPH